MSERPYADEGEVIATFNAVRSQLDRIEEQVKRTNGRVSALEKWRSFMTGAILVLAVFLTEKIPSIIGMFAK